MEIAAEYDESKNPNGYVVDGAPLRDISVEEWRELPDQVRRSVAAAPFYEVTPAGERAAETVNLTAVTLAIPGVSSDIVAALATAGFDTPDKIRAASDEELLAIPGIKEKRLAQIRLALLSGEYQVDVSFNAPAEQTAETEDGE